MKNALEFTIVVGVIVFIFGYVVISQQITTSPEEKIDGIVRVFMHEPSRYSLMIQKFPAPKAELRVIYLPAGNSPVFFFDVPPNQPKWALLRTDKTRGGKTIIKGLELHLNSEKDMDGGAWNHGKAGSGQTNVVQ